VIRGGNSASTLDNGFYQNLSLRARDQSIGGDGELQGHELPLSQKVREGLVVSSASDNFPEFFDLLRREWCFRLAEKGEAIHPQGISQQELRIQIRGIRPSGTQMFNRPLDCLFCAPH